MNGGAADQSEPARCYVCGASTYRELLRKEAVNIYTDSPDDRSLRHKYPCVLNQCNACGHVYEPVDRELRCLFSDLYKSADAQGPSPMGVGQWGMQRAERLFFDAIDLGRRKSAVEIGCGDGYLLKELKARGFERLTGIEPSMNIGKHAVDGITFIKDFIDNRLRLEAPAEVAFSVAVFEHIEDINGVLAFCRNNLTDDGELFFVVPNAERQLETGDPALFIHQHVHYFTTASITYLLARNGFQAKSIVPTADAFLVSAQKSAPVHERPAEVRFYSDYQEKLEHIIDRLRDRLATERVIMHGACNSLNNISGWGDGRFELADNDLSKNGKTFFGRTVKSPSAIDLSAWDTVVVIPTAYYEPIRSDYLARGFQGRVVRLDEQ